MTSIDTDLQTLLQQKQDLGFVRNAQVWEISEKGVTCKASIGNESYYFDIASLTKPLCTAFLVLKAFETGELSPASLLGELLPRLHPHASRTQLWHLLSHTSGLRPYDHAGLPDINMEKLASGSASVRLHSMRDRLDFVSERYPGWVQSPPGTQTVYSDLGYFVLGVVLESFRGIALADQFRRAVKNWDQSQMDCFAVQPSANWRSVQDPLARVTDSLSGHAGLLAQGKGLALWVHDLWGRSLLDHELWQWLWEDAPWREQQDNLFSLGFERSTGEDSTAGVSLPSEIQKELVGHLGYSGCSLWIHRREGGRLLLTDAGICTQPKQKQTEYILPEAYRKDLLALRQRVHNMWQL